MTKRVRLLCWLLPAAVVFGVGFTLATFHDLPLSQMVYNPRNMYAVLMEVLGWFPAFLPVVVYGLLLATAPKQLNRRWNPFAGAGVAGVALVAMYYKAWGYLTARGLLRSRADPRGFLWLLGGITFAVLLVIVVLRFTPAVREKMLFWALMGSVYMVANQLVINSIKLVWQRTRFDDMLAAGAGFGAFTPWYSPFANGGTSFPSGHTANMAGVFMLLVLCDLFAEWNRRRPLVYGLCWGLIAAMAFSRVMIGRHFLSDTLAGAGVAAVLFFCLRNSKTYKDGMCRARSAPKKMRQKKGAI